MLHNYFLTSNVSFLNLSATDYKKLFQSIDYNYCFCMYYMRYMRQDDSKHILTKGPAYMQN